MLRGFSIGLAIFLAGISACGERSDMHTNVRATVFWVGEEATSDNDFIPNAASAWDSQWMQHFGGIDDPKNRSQNGYWPMSFTPKENPFYFALPYGEFRENGRVKTNITRVPWYDAMHPSVPDKYSILKNRWIVIRHGDVTAYAQWEDVGPFESDDVNYVFGANPPLSDRAGLDLSPAAAAYLGIDGSGDVSWGFVADSTVPEGPWSTIVTTRQVTR